MKLASVAMWVVATSHLGVVGANEVALPDKVLVVADQAEAAVSILEKRAAGQVPLGSDWDRLWESEGFRRLAARQAAFDDHKVRDRLKEYLDSSDAMEALPEMSAALTEWRTFDVSSARDQALEYLPEGLRLRATIYPVIKRRANSFVHDLQDDPAIFIHLTSNRFGDKLLNTLTHELHHVGIATCPQPQDYDGLSPETQRLVDWLSAFGEGIAMLVAAGGPNVHPHASGTAEEWIVWERDVANFNRDVQRLEEFFLNVLDGEMDEEEERRALFGFINTEEVPQGAFYTVGWKMATLIEQAGGRAPLLQSMCDGREILSQYNSIVAEWPRADSLGLRLWSSELLDRLANRAASQPEAGQENR